jgi:hypothetical protein
VRVTDVCGSVPSSATDLLFKPSLTIAEVQCQVIRFSTTLTAVFIQVQSVILNTISTVVVTWRDTRVEAGSNTSTVTL